MVSESVLVVCMSIIGLVVFAWICSQEPVQEDVIAKVEVKDLARKPHFLQCMYGVFDKENGECLCSDDWEGYLCDKCTGCLETCDNGECVGCRCHCYEGFLGSNCQYKRGSLLPYVRECVKFIGF